MNLEHAEADRFFRVWWLLLRHVNRTLRVFDDATAWRDGQYEPEHEPGIVRELLERPEPLVASFVREEGNALDGKERALAQSWARLRGGYYMVVAHERRRTILVSSSRARTTYAVIGIRYPLETLFPKHMLPADGLFVLVPFGDRIVARAAGVAEHPIQWDAATRRRYGDAYRRAKERRRIVSRLQATRP